MRILRWPIMLVMLFLSACTTQTPSPTPTVPQTTTPVRTATPSSTPTRTVTPTWTLAPTRTQTPTATVVPSATPTPLPALIETALPGSGEPIIEANLSRLGLLAQWGRGRVDGLAWSSKDQAAVGTPLGVYLYENLATLDNPRLIQTRAPAGRLAFSADGRFLAVDVSATATGAPYVSESGEPYLPPHLIQIWDISATEYKQLATLDPKGFVLDMAFSSSNTLFVLVRQEMGAQFQRWDVQASTQQQAINLLGGETAMEGVFSDDLSMGATHGERGPVRIWRLSDGTNLATTREAGEAAGPMAFSPDARSLAVGYADDKIDFTNTNVVRVWSIPDGSPYADLRFTLSDPGQAEGAYETLLSVAWSPDGQMIAAGSEDYTVHVWKAVPSVVYSQLSGQTLPRFLAWSPSSTRLLTGGVEVWDVTRPGVNKDPVAVAEDYLPALFDMRFTPDGSNLALAGYSRVDFRSSANGSLVKILTGMKGPVNAISFDPSGELMVAACQDGTARVYLVKHGIQTNILGEPTYPMMSVNFSSNGSWVAVGGEDMLVRVYRVKDGALMIGLLEPFASYELAFAPNSDQFASLTTAGVRLRSITNDLEEPETSLLGTVGGVGISDIAYSPDSRYLALVGNNVVRVVNPYTREDVYSLNQPSGATPLAAAFSPDNAFLAVGWSDGYIRLYWAADGAPMRAWPAHPETVQRLAFSEDSRLLASMGGEGTIRLWGIAQ